MQRHIPVMLNEILEYLRPAPGKSYIDCTLGAGGYTFALSKLVGGSGRVYSFDMDGRAIAAAEEKIKKDKITNIELINDNFKNLDKIFETPGREEALGFDGVVFDLGLSSDQLADPDRGFTFQLDAPLDMSFGGIGSGDGADSTRSIVNKWSGEKLERIIREYGEEPWAKKIAASIVAERKNKEIATTAQLLEAIRKAIPSGVYADKRLHFATKTFQAFRILTNRELENISEALPKAMEKLKEEGRLAVVSFHSLEDRIVKRFFKKESKDCLCPPEAPLCVCGHRAQLKILTKKVVRPSEEEIKKNPRARSALLRVAERIM